MYTEIRFTLNGEQKLYQGDPLRRLLDVLREDYGLTGSKEGCGEGECGACSIIKNGELALKGLNRGTFENILLNEGGNIVPFSVASCTRTTASASTELTISAPRKLRRSRYSPGVSIIRPFTTVIVCVLR